MLNWSVNSLNWRKILFYLMPPVLAMLTVLLVNFKTDLSAFIISGSNAEEILLASEMQSGTLSRRYLISVAANKEIASDSQPVFIEFGQSLIKQLKTIEGVVDVWVPNQQNHLTQTIQTLYGNYANSLYSLDPEQDLKQFFSSTGLKQRADLLKSLLLSPQAVKLKSTVLQDPLLLTLNSFKSVSGQIQNVISNDNRYLNLVLETGMAGLDTFHQSHVQEAIRFVFEKLNARESSLYTLEMTGVPVFAVATQTLMQGDVTKVSVVSSLFLTVIFFLLFRSFTVMVKVFSILMIVILSAILMTQLVFGYVHGMTIAIGSTLVGICIDYPIHAVVHAQSVSVPERISVTAKVWPSMLLGGLTTIIGYVALGSSGYPGFQQVAVYATGGIIISLLLTRFVLPRLMTDARIKTLHVPGVMDWSAFTDHYRKLLLAVMAMLIVWASFNIQSLHWMEDMQELTPELNYLKQNDRRIRERMTSIEPGRFVLVTGIDFESALQTAERLYPVLDQLKQTAALSDYYGLYPWLLSERQQRLNRTALQAYLTEENRLKWQQALKQNGLSVKKLGGLDYASDRSLNLSQLLQTPVKQLIDSRIVVGENQTLIMIWLGQHQPDLLQRALKNIKDVQYFSQRDMINNMTREYTERAQLLLMTGVTLIILILLLRYKSLVKTVQTLLPSVLAAFLILIVWSFTGAAISFLHLVGFLLVIAICVDYGIFYQENRGGNITLTYQAMAVSMLTSAVAFGSLVTAESTSLRILSGVVAFGVILGFVLCPLIIRQPLHD